MSDLHAIEMTAEFRERFEGVAVGFDASALERARAKSWEALAAIRPLIVEGMNEEEARKVAMERLADLGVTKHWHRVYVRLGPGTVLTFNDPLQLEYRLKPGDPFYVDIGPVWRDEALGIEYEGDVGDTFILGGPGANPEAQRCADAARAIFRECSRKAHAEMLTGEEIYAWLKTRVADSGYQLIEIAAGHRLSEFPHHKHSKASLGKIRFIPSASLWVLEVLLRHPTLPIGAFFEDLL